MRKMKIKVHRSLLFFSFAIGWIAVSITPLFDTIIVTSEYDLTKHRIGFPLPIIEQHTSLTPLEDAFPFQLGMVNPQGASYFPVIRELCIAGHFCKYIRLYINDDYC